MDVDRDLLKRILRELDVTGVTNLFITDGKAHDGAKLGALILEGRDLLKEGNNGDQAS